MCFVNLTSFSGGAAVFRYNAMMNNTADDAGGGAVNMLGEMITVGAESCVIFTYNQSWVVEQLCLSVQH